MPSTPRVVPSALALLFAALTCDGAQAVVVMKVSQQGSNVVVTGSGSIDTTGLTRLGFNGSWIKPQLEFDVVQVGSGTAWVFTGFTGPAAVGPTSSGLGAMATSGAGDTVGLTLFNGRLFVPVNYASGSPLSGTATFANRTLAGLGLTTGQYGYTWGSGAHADALTVVITSVPEPGSIGLMLAGGAALVALARRTGRAAGRPDGPPA